MQRHRVPLLVTAACACAAAMAAWADGSVGGSLEFTSDYIYHGLSQSRGDPAVQADIHYRSASDAATGENFIGLWGSTISRAMTGGTYELNAYAGRTFLVNSDSSATLSFVHYAYPNDRGSPRYDYDELSGSWAYRDFVFFTVAWTPDTAAYTERGLGRCCRLLSYDVALHQSLGYGFTLSAALGYDELKGDFGYAYWNGGIDYAIGPFQLDLSYFAMQPRAAHLYGDAIAGNRWVGTLIWRF
jgi:uncharacterized protein (TIGR02001 family)